MFSRVRIAIRFFFVGLAVGVLLAPRSGLETRRILRQRADRVISDLLDAATMSVPGNAGRPAQAERAGSSDGDGQGGDAGEGGATDSPDGGSGWQEPAMSSEEA